MDNRQIKIIPKKKTLPSIIPKSSPSEGSSLLNKINSITAKKRQLPGTSTKPTPVSKPEPEPEPEPTEESLISELETIPESDEDQVSETENDGEDVGNNDEGEDDDDESDDEEYENVLNPQLQELLEYMADDEKVFLIKGSQLEAMAEIMRIAGVMKDNYQQEITDLLECNTKIAQQLSQLKQLQTQNSNALSVIQSQRAPVPAPVPAPAPAPVQAQNKNSRIVTNSGNNKQQSLAKLLEDFNSSKAPEVLASDPAPTANECYLNNYFDTVYILNINNQALQLGEKLQKIGLQNITVINAKILPRVAKHNVGNYCYWRDALEHAIENNLNKILVLQDNIILHNNINYEFNTIHNHLENAASNWQLLQLGFIRKINPHRQSAFDFGYYRENYPSLKLNNEKDAIKHWKRIGYREGRVGAREIFEDEIESEFAVGVKNDLFESILALIEKNIKKLAHNKIFPEGVVTYGVRPNLFITDLKATRRAKVEYAKYQWNLDLYKRDFDSR